MICKNCDKEFQPSRGNNFYCSFKCKENAAAQLLKEKNAIIKEFRGGFLSNYDLFVALLPVSGEKKISLIEVLKSGFDQDAYYTIHTDSKGNEWKKVHDYFFMIENIKGQININIYKQ